MRHGAQPGSAHAPGQGGLSEHGRHEALRRRARMASSCHARVCLPPVSLPLGPQRDCLLNSSTSGLWWRPGGRAPGQRAPRWRGRSAPRPACGRRRSRRRPAAEPDRPLGGACIRGWKCSHVHHDSPTQPQTTPHAAKVGQRDAGWTGPWPSAGAAAAPAAPPPPPATHQSAVLTNSFSTDLQILEIPRLNALPECQRRGGAEERPAQSLLEAKGLVARVAGIHEEAVGGEAGLLHKLQPPRRRPDR